MATGAESSIEALVHGHDPTSGIVAVEPSGGAEMLVYRRLPAGRLVVEQAAFAPWLLTSQVPETRGHGKRVHVRELGGPHRFRWLVQCADWETWRAIRSGLRANRRPCIALDSPVEQYLVASGRTLFKGLRFEDLVRLQLDLETNGLDPLAPNGRILLIALSTNHGLRQTIGEPGQDEATLIRALDEVLQAVDPDVIEGHNIFNFDLPFLVARAERLGVRLRWGRNGAAPRLAPLVGPGAERGARYKVGGRAIVFRDCRIHGRHVVDTYHQVQRYDAAGLLDQYGLKPAVAALGLERPGRTHLNAANIGEIWRQEPDTVRAYALDDVLDTQALAALTLPTEFYQAQIVPWAFQDVAVRGPGEKIDDLLLRAYLAADEALPSPANPRAYPGGHLELRRTGLFRPVVKADVESLYPSLMLTRSIAPASDHLGVFLPILGELTARRLDAKRRMRQASGQERAYWQGLQGSLKVLINSFYGYLGYGRALFSDAAAAAAVTMAGQAVIKEVVADLEQRGALVIEVDTDGVYAVPPPHVTDSAAAEAFVEGVADRLGPGIVLALDGFFPAMISLRLKNYLLLEANGSVVAKGSSLRSRSVAAFVRRFAREVGAIFMTVDGPAALARARDHYLDVAARLQAGQYLPREIGRVLTLTRALLLDEHVRELAGRAGNAGPGDRLHVYRRRGGSLALVDEYANDADTDELLRHLHDMAGRFALLTGDATAQADTFPPVSTRTDIPALRRQVAVRQSSFL